VDPLLRQERAARLHCQQFAMPGHLGVFASRLVPVLSPVVATVSDGAPLNAQALERVRLERRRTIN
jgi:hypothetical protein